MIRHRTFCISCSIMENQATEKLTNPAPHEPSIAGSQPYTDIIYVEITKGYDDLLWKLVKDCLGGCGRVDLHKVVVSGVLSAASECVQVGFCGDNDSSGIRFNSLKPSGAYIKAGAQIIGMSFQKELVPESLYSRQLYPPSGALPQIKLQFSATKDMPVLLQVYVRVLDYRFHKIVYA